MSKTTDFSVGDIVEFDPRAKANLGELKHLTRSYGTKFRVDAVQKVQDGWRYNADQTTLTLVAIEGGRGSGINLWASRFRHVQEKDQAKDIGPSRFVRKHWILCVLDGDGRPLPAEKPALYLTQEVAEHVAAEMANRYPGKVFAAYEMRLTAQAQALQLTTL